MESAKHARREEGSPALPHAAARLLRLLGLHPGVDFPLEAAASLAGERIDVAQQQLESMARAGVITPISPGRFQILETFRGQLADQARQDATEADQARVRLVSWYLHTSDWLQYALAPYDSYDLSIEVPAGVAPRPFDQPEAALAWWENERTNIVSIVRVAAEAGLHGLAWRMAVTLRAFYAQRNLFIDWEATATIAAASAVADDDLDGQALTAENLAKLYAQTRRLEQAELSHQAALEIFRRLGDCFGEGRSRNALGLLALRHRQLPQALTHFEDSSVLFTEIDMPRWVAVTRSNATEALIELDRHTDAAQILTETVETFAQLGDRPSEGNALFLLSRARRAQGDLAAARTCIDAALAIAAEARNPMWQGYWLLELGRIQRAAGQHADALATFEQAVAINHRLGDRSREAQALNDAGQTYQDQGRAEEALTFHQAAEPAHREFGDRWHQAISLHGMATALESVRRLPEAQALWEQAQAALADFDDPAAARLRREITIALDRFRTGERHGHG